MKHFTRLLVLALAFTNCTNAQQSIEQAATPQLIGGRCEGCEAVFEYGNRQLNAVDTLPDFESGEPKIKITGTIYQPDGKTPASGVILYVYHTDKEGLYSATEGASGWGRRHGYNRGWIKTGADGRYTFYTIKAGQYPSRNIVAHIHPTILEPDGRYYYLEDYYFEGDNLLGERERSPENPRGGTAGVLHFQEEGDLLVAERDLILGANISDY